MRISYKKQGERFQFFYVIYLVSGHQINALVCFKPNFCELMNFSGIDYKIFVDCIELLECDGIAFRIQAIFQTFNGVQLLNGGIQVV